MNNPSYNEITFPVDGMACGSCASHVELAIKKLPGVKQVGVNQAARQVKVTFDPLKVDLIDFQQALAEAGYSIPTDQVMLKVSGMSCMSCVSHIQGAAGELPGVLDVLVHLSKGTVQVTFIPKTVTPGQIIQALSKAGYPAHDASEAAAEVLAQEPQNAPAESGWLASRFKRMLGRS